MNLVKQVEQAGDPCGKPPERFEFLSGLSDEQLDRLLNIVIVEGRARGFSLMWHR